MFKRLFAVALGAGLFLLTGCDQKQSPPVSSSPASRVAIVDLDKVAQSVGWNEEMRQSLAAVDQDIQSRWNALRDTMQSTIQAERKKLPEHLTQEQTENFNRMAMGAENQLRTAATQAQQESARVRTDLIRQYREQIKPSVRRVAEKANISIVLLPVDSVLYAEPSTDLTDKVIDDLQANKPTSRPMPAKVNVSFGPSTAPAPAEATSQPAGH